MRPFTCTGAGFLLAVLWFDLMFDVQALRRGGGEPPAEAVASIAAYYRRVTTAARPMNRLVATMMLATLGTILAAIARAEHPRWVAFVALALALAPIALAGARTVPNAVRLGAAADPPAVQAALARAIGRDHVLCFLSIATLIVLELAFGG